MIKSKKKPKLTTEQILKTIINEDALESRRNKVKVVEVPIKEEIEEKVEEFKWWKEPMDKKLFTKKKIGNNYFAHYEHWKEEVWIGGYESSKELDLVIKSYVEETLKPFGQRDVIKNIKSIILKN